LSEEEMFYLESRGLPPEDAKAMLLVGYFEDILGDTPESFRQETLQHIGARIGAVT
jgi:Fe-S cluster assembly scaffold protein SufB